MHRERTWPAAPDSASQREAGLRMLASANQGTLADLQGSMAVLTQGLKG